MDKDLLQYLANLATVRNHTATLANTGSRQIDQKKVRQASIIQSRLDNLFLDVIISGNLPGPVSVTVPEEECVDISQKIRDAKAELLAKNQTEPKEVEPPSEEVDAFEQLLAKAEKQVKPEPKAKKARK